MIFSTQAHSTITRNKFKRPNTTQTSIPHSEFIRSGRSCFFCRLGRLSHFKRSVTSSAKGFPLKWLKGQNSPGSISSVQADSLSCDIPRTLIRHVSPPDRRPEACHASQDMSPCKYQQPAPPNVRKNKCGGIWQRSAIVCTSVDTSRDLMKMLPLGAWSAVLFTVSSVPLCSPITHGREEQDAAPWALLLLSILSWHNTCRSTVTGACCPSFRVRPSGRPPVHPSTRPSARQTVRPTAPPFV